MLTRLPDRISQASSAISEDGETSLDAGHHSFGSDTSTTFAEDGPTNSGYRPQSELEYDKTDGKLKDKLSALGADRTRDDLDWTPTTEQAKARSQASVDVLDGDYVDPADMATWAGQSSIKGSTEAVRMVLLTFIAIGVTFTWGVEMTYCTPYLLSLGLTKGQTSMVWIAGPLSGLIMQPIIGVMADESTSKWGRRRPTIIVGSIIVALSLLMLGFTKELVVRFVADPALAKTVTLALAVLSLYSVDFAINAVMSCSRSLIVDTLSETKQQAGMAWGSRMSSLGHIIGYGMGAVDLVQLLGPMLGDTQFKQLTIIAALTIIVTSAITCWAVTERVLLSPGPRRQHRGRFKVFKQIWSTLLTLPPRFRAICSIVFWAWLGWYAFHIYGSTWVGETYFRYDVPVETKSSNDALGDMGRIGSVALTIFSLVTFASAWTLPFLIKSPDDDYFTHRPPASLRVVAKAVIRHKPDLLTAWFWGHLVFAAVMVMTPFAASFRFATFLVAVCGLPWTVITWASTTIMGEEVNKLSGSGSGTYRRFSDDAGPGVEMRETRRRDMPYLEHDDKDADVADPDAGLLENGLSGSVRNVRGPAAAGSTGELSGVYFGIMNIYSTVPQFISTLISTVVFAILEPGKSPELAVDAQPNEHYATEGPSAISVVMSLGAGSAIMAAVCTQRLRKMKREDAR